MGKRELGSNRGATPQQPQATTTHLVYEDDPRATTSGIRVDPGMPPDGIPEATPLFLGSIEVEGEGSELPEVSSLPPPLPSPRAWLEDRGEFARGGMSRLHKAYHGPLRRTAAMKIMDKDVPHGLGARERFIEEAQITGQLDHPNIPPIHDFWVDETGSLRFTMKLVKGETLTERLVAQSSSERSARDWEALLNILLKVCDAISFAHSRGVIHRDIKPLLPKSSPLSISVDRDSTTTLDPPSTALGTAAYMAPEQARARVRMMNEQTDIYLLGGVLFEMLTGHPPHPQPTVAGAILAAQKNDVRDPQEVVGEQTALPPELCRIAKKALSTRGSARHETVDAFRREIEDGIRSGWWFSLERFRDGELVVREGETADAAFIITEGECEAFRMEDGKRVFLRKMGEGDAFGETALLTAQKRTASVQAMGGVTTRVITKEAFDRVLDDSWLRPFVGALAERFRELDERLMYIRRAEPSS
ncbi:MAG: cyclic nucleotide-binding domain-containing protein [Deltaproteobacteria bacterium]|nr:cyclic nucleotide-binding domain-containing protein [Deltaproteobacteria bacterium]